MAQQQSINTSNPQYDLVSILYHALAGASTYDAYVKDAEKEGDKELSQFFRDVQREENARADRAKELLAKRMR